MSTGSRDDGVLVDSDSLKSEARIRNRAVRTMAESGTLR
jgi:hypothetical protein